MSSEIKAKSSSGYGMIGVLFIAQVASVVARVPKMTRGHISLPSLEKRNPTKAGFP